MVGLPDATVRESRRPRPRRNPESRLRISTPPHHGEPGAGGRAQGGSRLRPSDRARHPRHSGPRRAADAVEDTVVLGELSLDGGIKARAADRCPLPPLPGLERRSLAAECRRSAVADGLEVCPAVSSWTRSQRVLDRSGTASGESWRARTGRSHPPDSADADWPTSRPNSRAPRARGRGGGRPQPAAHRVRPARARRCWRAHPGRPAAAHASTRRSSPPPFTRSPGCSAGRRPARAAAVPRAAPHDLGRGARRRRRASPARAKISPRAQRRAVPRRDAGIRAPRPRGAAPAARRGRVTIARAAGRPCFLPGSCWSRR